MEIYIGSSNQYLKINGTTARAQTSAIGEQISPYSVYLFDLHAEGIYGHNFSYIKLYDCKIYIEDMLVRNLVPVKDKNNVVCLFDKVYEEFYYNKGTGSFIGGEN